MSNTTNNIKNEYTSLAKEGNLHDATIAELYETGNASYAPHSRGIVYTISNEYISSIEKYDDLAADYLTTHPEQYVTTQWLYINQTLPTEDGTYFIPLPNLQIFQEEAEYPRIQVVETYDVSLDPNTSTGMYKDFAESSSSLKDFAVRINRSYQSTFLDPYPLPEIITTWNSYQANWDNLTQAQLIELVTGNLFSLDSTDYTAFIGNQSQVIYDVMTTQNTKLVNYLNTNYKNEVEHRFFKSINVTGTEDNVFYKIIDSNPTDTIDKVVMFKDPNKRTGNGLFNANDWAPYNSQTIFYDLAGNPYSPDHDPIETGVGTVIPIPTNYNDVVSNQLYSLNTIDSWTNPEAKFLYSQIIQVRFKRMMAGDFSNGSETIKASIVPVAAKNLSRNEYYQDFVTTDTQLRRDYANYLYDWGVESITLSANGNVVFTWYGLGGTPQTCTISNWTSKFSVVNPQHLEKTSKRVISPSTLHNFLPYAEWHKAVYGEYPTGEINATRSAQWFNTLNSDQFGFWIDPYTKQEDWATMSYDVPGREPVVVVRGDNPEQWNGINKSYIAPCGGYNQIIWGCGLSPDFMYPVVDISRPTPNTKTECLVYCNDVGYHSIKLAFVTATVEEYLLAKFKPNVNTNRQHKIINDINDWAANRGGMIFPKNVRCAYFANDTSNVLNCSGFRVAYLPSLVRVVDTVSTILCSFIGILCFIICFVIIKRYVENNRINIGIMRANGISKLKIALSLSPFALFPAVIGGIAAYITGLLLQPAALHLFSNYWMLPTPLIAFDWVSFLACIFLPFALFSIICFFTTMLVLRVNSVELMKSGSEFKTNSFSRIAKKPFKHFGVITRFRVSLAFNSITRLLMLAAMSCLTMSSLVFAMTTFDKLNMSKTVNSSQFDYKFNIELTTPTVSGSVFSVYDYSKTQDADRIQGLGYSDPENYIFNLSWNTCDTSLDPSQHEWRTTRGYDSYPEFTKWYSHNVISGLEPLSPFGTWYKDAANKNGNLMMPTTSDATGQDIDLLFLQNKFCSRLSLDHSVGLPGVASSNPWEIALALMPANSRNMAADSYNKMINVAGHRVHDGITKWQQLCVDKGMPESLVHTDTGHVVWSDEDDWTETVHEAAEETGKWMDLKFNSDDEYWYNNFAGFFIYDKDTDTYTLNNDILVIGELLQGFNEDFIHLLRTIYTDADLLKMEYPITYGNVPLNWNVHKGSKPDETYTYVSGKIKALSNHHSFDPERQIKIEGIANHSDYIKLTDKNGKSLNERLFDDSLVTDDTHPIIINAYAAHKYSLSKGSIITLDVTNMADRYIQKIHPENYAEDANEVKFKVVGISQGTNNEAYYTAQKRANDILGLPNGISWNKTHKYMMWAPSTWTTTASGLPALADLGGVGAADDSMRIYKFSDGTDFLGAPICDDSEKKLSGVRVPIGFNGIYTENDTGKPITGGLSLYSYTGMYPGSSVFESGGGQTADKNNKFAQTLSYGANLAIANLMVGGVEGVPSGKELTFYQACQRNLEAGPEGWSEYEGYIDQFIQKLVDAYGKTTMITSIAGANDVAASDLIYSNLIATFDLAQTSIMSIIIPITIIIVTVISNLIITDSKKMAAMMKALGYSDAKNLMSILALFVPTIILGLGLAVPLSFGLTIGYQSIIFNTANILVDVTQKWWYYVAAVGGIGIILIGTYGIGFVSIKRDRLVDQIK